MFTRKQKETAKQFIPAWVINAYHRLRLVLKEVYLFYFRIAHRGNTYFCPFCNKSYARFLPDGEKASVITKYQIIGGGYRNNCLCPGCGSKDRERLLYLYLQQKTDIFTAHPKQVLHIAPEKNLKKVLQQQPQLHYVNADLNPGAADLQMDITDIPYPDNFFDVVLCNHVLEHIPDDAKAMRELYRILKPNGWAILQVPVAEKLSQTYENPDITHPADRETHFGQLDHVRIYGQDYLQRLQNAGFITSAITAIDLLGKETVAKLSLIENEKVFYAVKQTER